MLTQVYEISTPEEARALAAIGIDHVGVLVGNGQFPREQPIAAATRIAAEIVPPARFAALFLTADTPLIKAWVNELCPSIVHLGAAPELLSPTQVRQLKQKLPGRLIMRSVPVFGDESIAIAQSYDSIADYLLLDSYRPFDPADRSTWRDTRLADQPAHRGGGAYPRPSRGRPWSR